MNSHNDQVAILLATYNSSKYLIQQIDSLLIQTFQNWTLYISDDGSIDDTLSIIERYCTRYDNIVFLKDEIKARGAKNRFMWLLEHVDADYYMFCDHDDIWLNEKIQHSFDKIKELEYKVTDMALLVYTDLIVVDKDLNKISNSYWKYSKLNQKLLINYNYLCVVNGITGSTIILNNKAKNISLPMSEYATMHDRWIALCVSKFGIISYLEIPTILYRQHDANVLGAQKFVVNLKYFISKILNLSSTIRQNFQVWKMIKSIDKNFLLIRYIIFKLLYLLKR